MQTKALLNSSQVSHQPPPCLGGREAGGGGGSHPAISGPGWEFLSWDGKVNKVGEIKDFFLILSRMLKKTGARLVHNKPKTHIIKSLQYVFSLPLLSLGVGKKPFLQPDTSVPETEGVGVGGKESNIN